MTLRDHFRPPLGGLRRWHAFLNAWATYISSQLNACLPEDYFAEPSVQFGIEIDVAGFKDGDTVQTGGWTPPAPHASLPVSLNENRVEVNIFSRLGGPELAGAIELVSPANKDRPANREAFTAKCAAYLQRGVGLVVVDVVTEGAGHFHNELLVLLQANAIEAAAGLYASAYRPVDRNGGSHLDVWYEGLEIGGSLPTLPLWLKGGYCLPVELQATYERTCREQRLDRVPPLALASS